MVMKTRTKKQNGYVLLDALVAVFISAVLLTAVMGSISSAARMATLSKERILQAIEERNAFEKEQRIEPEK